MLLETEGGVSPASSTTAKRVIRRVKTAFFRTITKHLKESNPDNTWDELEDTDAFIIFANLVVVRLAYSQDLHLS